MPFASKNPFTRFPTLPTLVTLAAGGVALAAMGSDLIDKPLAAAYFYRKQKAAVLFAHTFLAYFAVALWTWKNWPRGGARRECTAHTIGASICAPEASGVAWRHDTF